MAQRLVKRGRELSDAPGVLMREHEAALQALREAAVQGAARTVQRVASLRHLEPSVTRASQEPILLTEGLGRCRDGAAPCGVFREAAASGFGAVRPFDGQELCRQAR